MYYEWVDVARGIGIFLVVLGHAIADIVHNEFLFEKLFQFIYSFHMPLFFFLSGFCGAKVFQKKRWCDKKSYIIERFKRLMIPYIFVGMCYIPVKLLMSNYVTKQINIKYILLGFLCGDNPNSQLWTLYVLFLDAAIVCLIVNNRKYTRHILIFVTLIMSCASIFVDSSFGRNFMFESLFYVLGLTVKIEIPSFCDKVIFNHKSAVGCGFVVGMALLIGINIYGNVDGRNPIKIVTAILGIIVVCGISFICKEGKVKDFLRELGKYSMDIYIMANIFQVFVRIVFLNTLKIDSFICLGLSVLLGIIVPIIISKNIVRKYKITSKLILGIF